MRSRAGVQQLLSLTLSVGKSGRVSDGRIKHDFGFRIDLLRDAMVVAQPKEPHAAPPSVKEEERNNTNALSLGIIRKLVGVT